MNQCITCEWAKRQHGNCYCVLYGIMINRRKESCKGHKERGANDDGKTGY